MVQVMDLFKTLLIVQLFFAFGITGLTHTMPEEALNYVTSFSDLSEEIDLEGVSDEIEDGIENQINIPVIELGALVFYSGNILIDMLVNFAFAIPEMLALLIDGVFRLMNNNIDPYIVVLIQLVTSVMIMVMYFLGLIQLLTGLRSGRLV